MNSEQDSVICGWRNENYLCHPGAVGVTANYTVHDGNKVLHTSINPDELLKRIDSR